MYISNENKEKIKALDKLLIHLPTDYINQLAEADNIVSKIKAEDPFPDGFIMKLVNDNQMQEHHIKTLQNEVYTLRSHLQALVKIMSRPLHDPQSSYDLNSLKNSLGVH